MKLKIILSPVAFAVVSACGGSSDNSDASLASFEDLRDQTDTLYTELETADITDYADLPTSGSATYEGSLLLAIATDEVDGALGVLEMTADFADSTISGNASNFFNPDQERVAGSVNFTNGEILEDSGGAFFTTDVSGSVTIAGGSMEIDGESFGYFAGNDGELLTGLVTGSATDTSGDSIYMEGLIAAEQ